MVCTFPSVSSFEIKPRVSFAFNCFDSLLEAVAKAASVNVTQMHNILTTRLAQRSADVGLAAWLLTDEINENESIGAHMQSRLTIIRIIAALPHTCDDSAALVAITDNAPSAASAATHFFSTLMAKLGCCGFSRGPVKSKLSPTYYSLHVLTMPSVGHAVVYNVSLSNTPSSFP